MKAPKDLSKYTDSSVAAAQLLSLAIERILLLKPGWKIKWSCSISMWNDNPPAGMKIIPRQGTYSSVGDGEHNRSVTTEHGDGRVGTQNTVATEQEP